MEHSRSGILARVDPYLAALLVAPVGLMLVTGPGVTKSLFYVAALAAALAWAGDRTRPPALHMPSFALAALTIAWTSASHAWSPGFDWLEQIKLAASGAALLVFVALGARTARRTDELHSLLLAAGAIAGLLALGTYVIEAGPRDHFGRLLGYAQLRNPVMAGGAFGFLALIALLRARKGRWWYLAAALFIALTLATGSRSPLLALGVCAFFGLAGRWRAAAALGVIGVLLLPLFADIPDSALAGRDFTRFAIWLEAARGASGLEWAIGRGLGAPFEVVVASVPYGHPHSVFAATFVHGGLIGLISLAVLSAWLVKRAYAAPASIGTPFLYGLVIVLLDGSRLVGDINLVWLVYWLPAGALMARSFTAGKGDRASHRV